VRFVLVRSSEEHEEYMVRLEHGYRTTVMFAVPTSNFETTEAAY